MAKLFRPNQWWLRLLIGVVVVTGMIWLSRIAYGQGIETHLKVMPEKAYPGDIVLVEVSGPSITYNRIAGGRIDGKNLRFFWHENRLLALGAISLEQKAGILPVVIFLKGAGSHSVGINITVGSRNWPERHVGETPSLSPRKMARYLKEKALIKKAFKITAPEPLWASRFFPAVFAMNSLEVTSPFGQKRIGPTKSRQHRGIDLRASVGTPVRSMNSGRVVLTGNFIADGKIVILDHGLGLHTLYLHLSRIKIKKGQLIKRGQILGLSGNTGFSEGPHLHLEVRLNGEPVNPFQILEIPK